MNPIRQVRDKVFDLENIEELMPSFYTSIKSQISITKFKKLSEREKKQTNNALAKLKFLYDGLILKQRISDNLEGLACYLGRLKVNTLTKDYRVTRKILYKFLQQDDMNLNFISADIDDFRKKLITLKRNYKILSKKFNIKNNNIQQLSDLCRKQKQLHKNITKIFNSLKTELKKDKKCRSFFNKSMIK